MTPTLEDNLELELCPFLKECNESNDSMMEDYCVINYSECPIYQSKRTKENEKDVKLYGI